VTGLVEENRRLLLENASLRAELERMRAANLDADRLHDLAELGPPAPRPRTKTCPQCTYQFSRRPHEAVANFEERTYCSTRCANLGPRKMRPGFRRRGEVAEAWAELSAAGYNKLAAARTLGMTPAAFKRSLQRAAHDKQVAS